jgi:isopentenyl-diphosphate delta-isomerase
MAMDKLILVNENDEVLGYEDKESCHRKPTKRHRAFSVFILNSQGQMLVHKRSRSKKTWPGFWSNACCSHPRKGEGLSEATQRRLLEELGFTCPLEGLFRFEYSADYDDEWGENEIDYVFLGIFDGDVKPDYNEIEEWLFIFQEELMKDIEHNQEKYTPWFKKALPRVINHIKLKSGTLPMSGCAV